MKNRKLEIKNKMGNSIMVKNMNNMSKINRSNILEMRNNNNWQVPNNI